MSFERALSAVRALLARELVERGLSVNETAKLLGLTPAAVSMYVSGKRGGELVQELAKDERVMGLIKSHADILVDAARKGIRGPVDLTELAKVISNIMSQRGQHADLEELIRSRIRLEQETASRAMAYSYKVKNPLIRALFMQIAADSLRHAEILTMILDYLGGRLRAEGIDLNEEELEVLAAEEGSMRESIADLYRIGDPVLRALILSIELDEGKHFQLIRTLQLAARQGKH
ncbi:helix-turn-helix domain-containing protein [Pyrobaculum aerophilum]|uniref:Transcriptional regulator n=1 Tax=Pyrobaculum aerophilum TaxID=13773 RepID=A0A371R4T4_9CREN|nr:helix-turn-helix domain-containing protein [Pyrobaculum aerophilum]RFA98109.1 transcriptional regulator [Pyrobaculum aerophilum]RFA99029.1 transcriptional regulator [Pyrobaculum aerophilum]